MLGKLYNPTGKALETAQQVLEVKNPMACNVAYGCKNCCEYCYIPYIKKGEIRFPKTNPKYLVEKQLKKIKPEGVFLCFNTDLALECNKKRTIRLIELLIEKNIKVATLSKIGIPRLPCKNAQNIRIGMTIVSDNDEFSKKFEPNALPVSKRIEYLRNAHGWGYYTWVSLEPFPTPNIWEQDLVSLLEKIKFVDFIIFGKWNYDKRANDKEFYKKQVGIFEDYCKQNHIRHFVKSETRLMK